MVIGRSVEGRDGVADALELETQAALVLRATDEAEPVVGVIVQRQAGSGVDHFAAI